MTTQVEFAGLEAPPDYRRVEGLVSGAAAMLPGLKPEVQSRWLGFRPSHPDSLPVIGPSPRDGRVICAYGHGHLGMTSGAGHGPHRRRPGRRARSRAGCRRPTARRAADQDR